MNKKYLYDVGYDTYEESEYCQLSHDEKFSQEEFDSIVAKATATVLKGTSHPKSATFEQVLCDVVEELKKAGFQEVAYTAKFSVFGWASILDAGDWKDNRDEQLNKLTKDVKKQLPT